jgi:putative intracellular protease/amidase
MVSGDPDERAPRISLVGTCRGSSLHQGEVLDVRIAIPLFPKLTALDAIGPYEVLQRVPEFNITFVGHERGEVRTENGLLGLTVDKTFEELADPEVIVFPGGIGTRTLIHDQRVLDWVREAHRTTRYTTSVCTGSLVLGAAGLLKGLTATSHWSVLDLLSEFGAIPTSVRVVEHLDQRIITAAGVSSGIDMALHLLELLVDSTAAKASQLMIEYDPRPPFDAGAPSKVDDTVLTRVKEYASVRQ